MSNIASLIATLFAHPIVPKGKLGYLLNLNQKKPCGKSKAKFFNLKGFSLSNSAQFATTVKVHPTTAELFEVEVTPTGLKFKFRCDIATPSGQFVCIVSVWQIDFGKSIPRLITAHPA